MWEDSLLAIEREEAARDCPYCGSNAWVPAANPLVIYETGTNIATEGAGVEVLAYGCSVTGFMRFHSTKVLGIDTQIG
jgi:hypothetical protein